MMGPAPWAAGARVNAPRGASADGGRSTRRTRVGLSCEWTSLTTIPLATATGALFITDIVAEQPAERPVEHKQGAAVLEMEEDVVLQRPQTHFALLRARRNHHNPTRAQ